jgi:hypothetical protein
VNTNNENQDRKKADRITKAKRYRAHGCKEKDCTFIENSAGRNDKFSKVPASA